MAVPTMEESALCSQLIERVKDYFQSAEHKKEFEEWYKTKYHKDYEWRCYGNSLETETRISG